MPLSRSVIVCLALALALSGCGRRGGLELPPEAKPAPALKPAATPLPPEPRRAFQKKPVPERPFILDGLI
jgi:predicted small lipoprotein YifL